ncbi:hypothetical protein SDD30_03685 [Moorella naiadis]|uniref:hypothetical protein n=1 Tax=Moorella naiadis (nom. illeg.) TaxID=3093670 RepID=UPI003D9C9E2A
MHRKRCWPVFTALVLVCSLLASPLAALAAPSWRVTAETEQVPLATGVRYSAYRLDAPEYNEAIKVLTIDPNDRYTVLETALSRDNLARDQEHPTAMAGRLAGPGGLGLMTIFFLALFLMDWLHLSLFFFMLPVIWLYSFFDALKLVSACDRTVPESEDTLLSWLVEKQRWVGLSLIALGVLIIFERVVVPYLSYNLINIIKTGFIAAMFIGGGVRLVMGSRLNLPITEKVKTESCLDNDMDNDINDINDIMEGERCNEKKKP